MRMRRVIRFTVGHLLLLFHCLRCPLSWAVVHDAIQHVVVILQKHFGVIPPDEEFSEEATEIRWSFRSDGKIVIEPKEDIKKRLGRSTDKFDALANTFYPIVIKRPVDKKRIAQAVY